MNIRQTAIPRRVLSLALCAAMVLTLLPLPTPAEGICGHHPEHTADCGYKAAVEGQDCAHSHDNLCGYQEASPCSHSHDSLCGYREASACAHRHTEECGENGESCTHQHDEACGYQEASPCTHSHDESCGYREARDCTHAHDDTCGYVEAVTGSPCTYRCEICAQQASQQQNGQERCTHGNESAACETCASEKKVTEVQALINALPETVTEENREAAQSALSAVEEAKAALTEAEQEMLDLTRCTALKALLAEPEAVDTGKVLTDWEWVDDYELIDPETGLAHLPFASAENIAYYDAVIEVLPAAITANEEELTLGDWLCEDYPMESGAYEGEYVFETTLPKGYVLADGTNVLRLTVVLGDPEGADASWYSSAPSTGSYTINGETCTAYELRTADDLFWFAAHVKDGSNVDNQRANAVLMNDITIEEGKDWTPIGGLGFHGKFDGQGHIIKNLHCNRTSVAGLFSEAEGAVIVNLGIEDSSFTVTGQADVGSICGSASESTIIKNCYSIASVTSTSSTSPGIGGLVGGANSSVISNCFFIGTVDGTAWEGGTGACVGRAKDTEVMNCYYNTDFCSLQGVGSPEGNTKPQAYGKTTAEFEKGAVAYELSKSASGGVWGQKILESTVNQGDPHPGFNDYVVYRAANYENYHNHKDHENTRIPYCLLCGHLYGSQLGDVYQITTRDQLYWFAAKVNGTSDAQQDSSIKARLGRDIELVDGWKPIGQNGHDFTGSFDGNGFTITCPSDTPMLFQTVGSGATIDHLRIGNGRLSETNNGAITRCVVLDSSSKLCATNGGTITNSYASGSGTMKLCDTNTGTIANCYAAGDSGTAIGTGGTITNCYTLAGGTATAVGGTSLSTESPFSSGEVAYLLNKGTGTYPGGIWGQAISTNPRPIHYGKTIYFNDTAKYHNHNGYCSTCNPAQPAYDESKGGWQISSADDLNWFAAFVNGQYTVTGCTQNAVLTADITVNTGVLNPDGSLSSNSDAFEIWTPIGFVGSSSPYHRYTGTFDGQNHTISGLYCPNAEYAGLFGILFSGASVRNVAIVDSYFVGTKDAGGVCGSSSNGCTIQNCSSSATVRGKTAGGICGSNTNGGGSGNSSTIQSCYSTGMVSGSGNVGGVCGNNSSSTIQECYFNSDVFTGEAIGSGSGTNVAGKTTKEFASGEVAYLLNGSKDNGTWKQTVEGSNSDATPQLIGEAVYKTVVDSPCPGYTNNSTGIRQHYHENHVCIWCGHQDTLPVTVSGITVKSKIYDGSVTAELDTTNMTLNGVLDAHKDTVTVTANGVFANANVGTNKTVTITLALGGANKDEYYLSSKTITTKAAISAKPVTAVVAVAPKTYDGTTTATVTAEVTEGLVSRDSITITGLTGTFDDANVGTDKTVTVDASGKSITGTGASNYDVTMPTKATGTINKAQATITVEAGKDIYSKTYGDATFQLTGITENSNDAEGVQYAVTAGTDVVTVSGSGQVTILKAGTATVTLSLPESSNYLAAQDKTIRIDVAKMAGAVNITGKLGKTYDGQPAALTEAMFSVTNDDGRTPSVEYKEQTADDSAYIGTAPTNAGDYTVRVTLEETDNYGLVTKTEGFTISPKPVTVSGITAKDKTYDGNTTATLNYDGVTFTGKLEGDSLSVTATGTFADANATENKTVTISGLNLGGDSKDNYVLALVGQQTTATATITKANASVTKAPEDAKSLYSGLDVPLVTAGTAQGGTMMYRLGEDGPWTAVLPQTAAHGEYTVYYYVKGDGNHEDTAQQSLKARIRPFEITGQTEAGSIKYGESTELSVTLNDKATDVSGITYQWCQVTVEDGREIYTPLEGETGSSLTLTKPNAGTYVYGCIITCGDDYSVTSNRATVTVTAVQKDLTSTSDLPSGLWAEGGEMPLVDNSIHLKSPSSFLLTSYAYNGASTDVHQNYPTGMEIYSVGTDDQGHTTVAPVAELNHLLRYSGCSIRITGKPGIRMITSLTKEAKAALKKGELAGYTLEEYGTVVAWTTELGDQPLTLSTGKSSYAYKKGVSDPVFANVGDLTQYTNVLVWDSLEDQKYDEDIVMRPYIKLSNKAGETVVLYGGTVSRSIGYVAQQNANTFSKGTAGYKYVHEIIDKVNALHSSTETNTTGG